MLRATAVLPSSEDAICANMNGGRKALAAMALAPPQLRKQREGGIRALSSGAGG